MQGVFMEKDTLWTSCAMKCMGQNFFVKQCLEIRSSLFCAFSDLITNLEESQFAERELRLSINTWNQQSLPFKLAQRRI